MASTRSQHDRYAEILRDLDQASRQHAGTRSETGDWQRGRAEAIIEISKLGVPRSTVAKLAGLTRGRVQQILEEAGEAGARGEDWNDPELRRLVGAAIADRPKPSVGVGLRRESTSGPHIGRGYGSAVRLTGDLEIDREAVTSVLEELLEGVRAGTMDELMLLTDEEREVVEGNLID
jgi:hypothetical protein